MECSFLQAPARTTTSTRQRIMGMTYSENVRAAKAVVIASGEGRSGPTQESRDGADFGSRRNSGCITSQTSWVERSSDTAVSVRSAAKRGRTAIPPPARAAAPTHFVVRSGFRPRAPIQASTDNRQWRQGRTSGVSPGRAWGAWKRIGRRWGSGFAANVGPPTFGRREDGRAHADRLAVGRYAESSHPSSVWGGSRAACTRTRRGSRRRTPGNARARSRGRASRSADTRRARDRRSVAGRIRRHRGARRSGSARGARPARVRTVCSGARRW